MRMNKDGLFKIMQITDMQEIPKVSPDTMALLDAAIEDEKPDLVVYTGDQIKGYGVSYKGKGKELENAVAKTINTLLEPVTKRNIPFAVTFGNHDRQVGISNKDQFNDIYKALPNCIGTQAEGIDGGGTYNIPIKASDGSDREELKRMKEKLFRHTGRINTSITDSEKHAESAELLKSRRQFPMSTAANSTPFQNAVI